MSGASSRALALGLALAVAGCSRVDDAATAQAQASAPEPAATANPVSVTVHTVSTQRVDRTVDFVGTLYAYAEAEVSAEVDGRLTAISADLGDQVAKGQILATLEGSELEAKLREAEASLQKNENDQKRAQQLRDQKIMSPQEFDAIASAASVSRARRDVLAIQVEHTRIRAPFDGRIAKRLVDVGNYVRTGTPVFVVVADNPLRLRGEVPERFASEVQIGQEVRGHVEAYPDDTIDGRLTRISPAANMQSRALTVEALVPNGDGKLKTGFFCKSQILTRTDAEALMVPVEALVTFAGVTRVFVVQPDGTARGREVETGLRQGALVEVTSGLSAGERVATTGLARLSDGVRVVVRESAPKPAEGRSTAQDENDVRIDPAPEEPRLGLRPGERDPRAGRGRS
ncbi:MAG TPA: efflux RND transporter periplasmic adaptor subunit [Candidatus Binatia bacterium]|nr:efflux RND transporter periplasmic adaptor subunit [Candidatus Binatia bacterium]